MGTPPPSASARPAVALLALMRVSNVFTVAPHVLRHRVQLTPEREMEGLSADQVISLLIKQLEVPR